MITRHVHSTVTFGYDEWADDEEVVYADSLVGELDDDDELEIDEDDLDDDEQ